METNSSCSVLLRFQQMQKNELHFLQNLGSLTDSVNIGSDDKGLNGDREGEWKCHRTIMESQRSGSKGCKR